jgi:hypothetical protein
MAILSFEGLRGVEVIAQDVEQRALREWHAAGSAASGELAHLAPEISLLELGDETIDAAKLQIASEDDTHLFGFFLDDQQLAILESVAERDHAADPQPFPLRSCHLVADALGCNRALPPW